ncbi:hypothetical protein MKX03_030415 [Papaver bracteatum]|nr:hypothetical protein MKX03_030415 [Papaver bracteatum]
MVNPERTVDEDGFITVARIRSSKFDNESQIAKDGEVSGGRRSEMILGKGKSIRVERKVIGGSMGKGGSRDVLHLAIWSGFRRRFCWLTFRAAVWLSRLLKREANGGDGKLIKWNFREEEDWMCASRQENKNGDFISLLVSHNREYPDTLIFPAGANGDGWWETGVLLEELLFGTKKLLGTKLKEKLTSQPVSNAWNDPKSKDNFQQVMRPENVIQSNQDLTSLWQRTLVVELASREVEWKEVGSWIMEKFDWRYGFDLQPIETLKAVFTVKTNAEFHRVQEFSNWKVGEIEIFVYPWFAGINGIQKPNSWSNNKVWVGVKGIPYNLWNYATYKAAADKLGGLVEVSPDTSTAMDLSEVRVRVNGPVREGSWCEEVKINNQSYWVEYRRIGDVLEQSREDLKPIYINEILFHNIPVWRRKVVTVVGDKEGDGEDEGLGSGDGTRGCEGGSVNHVIGLRTVNTENFILPVVLANGETQVSVINDSMRTHRNTNSNFESSEIEKEGDNTSASLKKGEEGVHKAPSGQGKAINKILKSKLNKVDSSGPGSG